MTPFAGVMLALVAMFMGRVMSVPDLPRTGVDLPRVYHPVAQHRANREDALFVGVARDGSIYFDQDRVRPAQLAEKIRDRLRHGAERKIYLRADARTKYGNVVEVLDAMQAAAVQNIGIICEERKPQSAILE
jgi:biopolymer transport protein ExbD